MEERAQSNRLLAKIGQYIRPLLSEAGNAMGMESAGFIGLCFALDDPQSRVMFAEYVNPLNRNDDDEGDYFLSADCAYVRTIERSAEEDKISPYIVGPDDPPAVSGPMKREFAGATEPPAIYAVYINGQSPDPILYFVRDTEKAFGSVEERVAIGNKFLIQSLRDAVFLADAAEPDLGAWPERLLRLLPDVFPDYTIQQKKALKTIRHPYAQWQGQATPVRVVKGLPDTHADFEFISAIRGFEEVNVGPSLSGSFQDHNVYSVTVTPTDGAKTFEAAVKDASQNRANKEMQGYFSLLPYFKDIRDVMPSAPLIWSTGKKCKDPKNGKATDEDQYTVLTPHLGGESLYDFIVSHWTKSGVNRLSTFGPIVKKLRCFIDNIRPHDGEDESSFAYDRVYKSHLSEGQRGEDGRFEKTRKQFQHWLAAFHHPVPKFSFEGLEFVNPLWMLQSAPREHDTDGRDDFWKAVRHEGRTIRYGHGDFHVGNILISQKEEDVRVTVLDFDYVGKHPEHEDPATLEASLVLAAAACPPYRDRAKWLESWPDAILFLSGKRALSEVENNRLANDLAAIVQIVRDKKIPAPGRYMPDAYHYHACLVTALLRLFTSHSKKMQPAEFRPVGATAVLWIGLLLNEMVRSNTLAVPIDLLSDLPKPM